MPNGRSVNTGVLRMKRLGRATGDAGERPFYGPSGAAEAAGSVAGGGGDGAAATFQKQVAGFYSVIGVVNTALSTMANVIKTQTTQALIQESRARGDLSKALASQATFSAAAQFAGALPLIGGALGGLIQAQHEQRQQAIGTHRIAAGAAVIEGRIPGLFQAGDEASLNIARGRIREKFAADPLQEQFQQTIATIRSTGAGKALTEFGQGRGVLTAKVAESEAILLSAQLKVAGLTKVHGGGPTTEYGRSERAAVSIAEERLRLDRESRAKLETPKMLGQEAVLRGVVATQEEQAGKDLVRAFSLRLTPGVGANFASFGRGPAGITGAPQADPATASASLTAAMNELTAALKGVNPTTVGK